MQLYAITDRRSLGAPGEEQTNRLLTLVTAWAKGGLDFIQIREKDLDSSTLLDLAGQVVETARKVGGTTRVLVNSSPSIAARSGADGVHLPGGWTADSVEAARRLWSESGCGLAPVISVACHTVADVRLAVDAGVTLAVFAPVFAKQLETGRVLAGAGLQVFEEACRAGRGLPVFALGGVTMENAQDCVAAGAAGIAGIRLFADSDWRTLLLSS